MQAVLALTSGAINEKVDPFNTKNRSMDDIKAGIKCYSVLLAHITGFASINFWSGVQQLPFFSSSPLMSILTLPISAISQLLLQRLWFQVRKWIALSDDG